MPKWRCSWSTTVLPIVVWGGYETGRIDSIRTFVSYVSPRACLSPYVAMRGITLASCGSSALSAQLIEKKKLQTVSQGRSLASLSNFHLKNHGSYMDNQMRRSTTLTQTQESEMSNGIFSMGECDRLQVSRWQS